MKSIDKNRISIMNVLLILFLLILFVFFTSRVELFINSGNLEYEKKFYLVGILILDKTEQTKLSQFIQKQGFNRKSNFIQIQDNRHPYSIPALSSADRDLKIFAKYLIPLYEQKLIDKIETKILISELMNIIEINNDMPLKSFIGDFMFKYDKKIDEITLPDESP